MSTNVAPCRDCGALAPPAGVCPVCQQFDPPVPRSVLVGVALYGSLLGGLAVVGWVGLLWWKWHRWQGLFGHTGGHHEVADAGSMAAAVGLLLFAVAGVGGSVLIAWLGRR